MSHLDFVQFCLQIAVILAAALCFGQLARRLHGPVVLGELIGGIVLGPTLLGYFMPALHEWLFPASGPAAAGRDVLTRLGLLAFLFVAGLEVNLAVVRRRGRAIVWTSLLGIVIPFSLGYTMVLFQSGKSAQTLALFMGTALSISALPVIARVLIDLNLQKTEMASVVLGAAIIDDLIGWSLFGVVLALAAPASGSDRRPWLSVVSVLALMALALTVGRSVVRRLRPWVRSRVPVPGSLIGAAAVLALLAAAGVEALGFHAIFGAFLVGLMMSQGRAEREQVHEIVYQFATGVLAPLYFVGLGLRVDFRAHFDLVFVLTVLVVACAGKILGATLGAKLGGMKRQEALAVGFGMNARGAMEIVLASTALEYRLIDERIFVALVIVALVTSLFSGPAMVWVLGRETELVSTV